MSPHVVTWTVKGQAPVVVEVPGDKDPFQIIDLMVKRADSMRGTSVTIQGQARAVVPAMADTVVPPAEVGSVVDHVEPATSAKASQPAAPAPVSRADHPSGVRATSHAAYTKLRFSGQLAEKQREIYNHFLATPMRTWTRSELAEAMGLRMNSCTGRVAEMLDLGVLEEAPEKRKCKITGENVTQLRVKE